MGKSKLTPRQQRFVDEYLIDLNATQAAIRAGYSTKGATVRGAELLANRKVQDSLGGAMKARENRTHITQDRVLQELARTNWTMRLPLSCRQWKSRKP